MIYVPGATVYLYFNTHKPDGTAETLTGTPTLAVYKDGTLAESVSGVVLTVDFDGRTGLNLVTINTAANTGFYTSGSAFGLVLTGGTVDGKTVDGVNVGGFQLQSAAPVVAGLVEWTYTVTQPPPNQTVPINGVEVWVSSDAAGIYRIPSGVTDPLGRVKFWLTPTAAGEHVYVWRRHPNWDFSNNPDLETVP